MQRDNKAQTGANQQTTFAQNVNQNQNNAGSQAWSWSGLGASSPRKASNASLTLLKDNMEKIADKTFGVKVIIIDKEQTVYSSLAFSSLVVIKEVGAKVFSHTLVFEVTGEDVSPQNETTPHHGTIQYPRTNDAAWDARYQNAVDAAVKSISNLEHVSTDGQLIRRFTPIATAEDASNLIRQAALAIETVRYEWTAAGRVNLMDMEPSLRLTSTYRQNQPPLVAFDMSHHRADWSIAVHEVVSGGQNNNNNNESVNNGQVSALISQTTGYVDLIPTDLLGQQTNPYIQTLPQQQQAQLGKFIPMVVMTTVDNTMTNTVSGQLLAIGAALLVMRDPASLYPYFNVAGLSDATIARRDPAALNIQGNLEHSPTGVGMIMADISKGLATDIKLGQYLTAMLKPEVAFGIRVSNFGPDSWVNGVFSRAADGDMDAQQLILQRANALTNNGLSNGDRLVLNQAIINDVQEVLIGTYKANDGSIRDIADLDYIAVANYFHNDPTSIVSYLKTIHDRTTSSRLRLNTQATILREVLGNSVEITGHGRLVKFTGEFVKLFCDALLSTNRAPARVNNFNGSFNTERFTPAWTNQAVTNYASAPMAGNTGRANVYGGQAFATARSFNI
jgi:hypothetical protein